MSYSEFKYSDLDIKTPILDVVGTLIAKVKVKNTSTSPGEEVIELYVRDLVGEVSRPIKELKGFQKIYLRPEEQKEISFIIPVKELGFHSLDMKYKIEPGKFQ